jgi:hypothetical protein
MEHFHLHFNLLAVLASGVFLWLLGWLWYSPVAFGKKWAALVPGPQGDKKRTFLVGSILSLIGDIVLAFVLAHVIIWSGTYEWGRGLFIGVVMWLGFFGAVGAPQAVFEGRPFKLFAINQCYYLLGLMLVGGILAVWR